MKLTTEHTLAKLHEETVRIAAQAELDRLAPGRFNLDVEVVKHNQPPPAFPPFFVGVRIKLACRYEVFPQVHILLHAPRSSAEVAHFEPFTCSLLTAPFRAGLSTRPIFEHGTLFDICRWFAQGFEPTTENSTL